MIGKISDEASRLMNKLVSLNNRKRRVRGYLFAGRISLAAAERITGRVNVALENLREKLINELSGNQM